MYPQDRGSLRPSAGQYFIAYHLIGGGAGGCGLSVFVCGWQLAWLHKQEEIKRKRGSIEFVPSVLEAGLQVIDNPSLQLEHFLLTVTLNCPCSRRNRSGTLGLPPPPRRLALHSRRPKRPPLQQPLGFRPRWARQWAPPMRPRSRLAQVTTHRTPCSDALGLDSNT